MALGRTVEEAVGYITARLTSFILVSKEIIAKELFHSYISQEMLNRTILTALVPKDSTVNKNTSSSAFPATLDLQSGE